MRERVNRYTVIFCNKMTAQISYGNTTLEENVYLQGLRLQRPGPLHRQPPAQRLRYKNVEGSVYRPPHYYPSITPPAKAFGGKDVVQDLLTPVFTNC